MRNIKIRIAREQKLSLSAQKSISCWKSRNLTYFWRRRYIYIKFNRGGDLMIPWKLCCNMLEIPVNTPVNIAPQCTWKPCKSCMCAKGGQGGRARKITKGRTIQSACVALENLRNRHNMRHGDGSKPIIIHFSGMNIHLPSFTFIYHHLPAILGFIRCQGFDP